MNPGKRIFYTMTVEHPGGSFVPVMSFTALIQAWLNFLEEIDEAKNGKKEFDWILEEMRIEDGKLTFTTYPRRKENRK